jgi:hypothetical protein
MLLTTTSINSAIAGEMHRISAPKVLLGGMDKGGTHIKLPGSKAPDILAVNDPDRVKPLAALMQEASTLGSELMRTGRAPGGQQIVGEGVPAALRADRVQSPAEANLAQLLSAATAASLDVSPEGERKYHDLIGQIAKAEQAIKQGAPTP